MRISDWSSDVCSSDLQALQLLAMYEYRAVISDMNRHGRPLAGLELVREMRQRQDDTPFFLYTVVPSEAQQRSEEHTSELQSLMRISYAVFCLKKKNTTTTKKISQKYKVQSKQQNT